MAELRFFTSNRLDILFRYLTEVLATPLSSPFKQEIIIVQSKVMERWLAMRLAEHFGVWANTIYPFPNAFLNTLFSTVLKRSEQSINNSIKFEKSNLTWIIYKLFPEILSKPDFKPLYHYLENQKSQLKEFQLASRIADVLDQYLFFRPDMIFEWEKNTISKNLLSTDDPDALHEDFIKANLWQKQLWKRLIQEIGKDHRARLRHELKNALDSLHFDKSLLPERIAIFSVTSLPPFHLDILQALSYSMEVNFFLMNPCKEYWYDINTDREIAKKTARKKSIYSAEELHLEKGNNLLASCGKIGMHFFTLLLEMESQDLFPNIVKYETFVDALDTALATDLESKDQIGKPSLLKYIQSDILNLRERKSEDTLAIAQHDNSIMIHSCHSAMREIEVLFDQLLAMLDQDPALKPEDILVMAPDIETYAPFIHAVFDRLAESDFPHAKAPHLPYNLSDRNVLRESVLIEPFLYFLTLPESRFGVLQIVKLLETEVIRKKLQWGEEDVLQIKNWIKETQIKWGIDGQDKVRQSLPPYVQNTWRSGIEQLLLGYAMSGEDLLHGILPYEKIDLSQASTLGTFISFIEEFFAFIELLRSPRSLSAWAGILNTALEQFFLYDELPVKELSLVQSALNQLREKQELAGYDAHLELEVIRSLLKDDLTREKMGHNFLSGGITFCDLLPMRSIPFKVICLLGMNDKAFPRITHTVGFDLMARDFKPGDRSTALSDRYLFLETILSAGDRLYISYIGQNIQDNSEYPPSVAISELLDTIRAGFKLEEATINQTTPPIPLAEKIQTKHRLQAFSTAYFSNHKPPDLMDSKNPSQYLSQGLFSFSKENYQASLAFLNKTSEKKTFLTDTLSPPEEGFKQVSVDELSYFFSHPTKFFMNQRLGLYLDQAVPELDERESFALTGLDRYQLKQNLITRLLSGQEIEPYYRIINAHGLLPHGNLGESYYQTSIQEVQIFLDKFNSLNKGQEIKPLKIDCSLQMFRISGDIPLWENGFFHYRCAPVKTKDRLKLWITHLVLNYYLKQAGTLPVCTTSTYLGEDECFSLNPIEDCEKKLLYLLECYWSGLSYLLPFFPDTSYEFTQSMVKKLPHLPENLNYYPKDMYQETEQWALNAAQKKWLGNDYASGEQDDLYYQLGYRNINPLDKKFMELALNIYLPLLKASL